MKNYSILLILLFSFSCVKKEHKEDYTDTFILLDTMYKSKPIYLTFTVLKKNVDTLSIDTSIRRAIRHNFITVFSESRFSENIGLDYCNAGLDTFFCVSESPISYNSPYKKVVSVIENEKLFFVLKSACGWREERKAYCFDINNNSFYTYNGENCLSSDIRFIYTKNAVLATFNRDSMIYSNNNVAKKEWVLAKKYTIGKDTLSKRQFVLEDIAKNEEIAAMYFANILD